MVYSGREALMRETKPACGPIPWGGTVDLKKRVAEGEVADLLIIPDTEINA